MQRNISKSKMLTIWWFTKSRITCTKYQKKMKETIKHYSRALAVAIAEGAPSILSSGCMHPLNFSHFGVYVYFFSDLFRENVTFMTKTSFFPCLRLKMLVGWCLKSMKIIRRPL